MCNKLSRCCALHRAKEMELDNAGEYEYGVLRVVTEWAGSENRTSPDNIPWFDSNAFYDDANTASTWSELGRLERLSLAIANIAPYSAECVERLYEKVSSAGQPPRHEADHGSVH